MSNKVGGWSYNSNGSPGVKNNTKCKHCRRSYKMEYFKNIHEKRCANNPQRGEEEVRVDG